MAYLLNNKKYGIINVVPKDQNFSELKQLISQYNNGKNLNSINYCRLNSCLNSLEYNGIDISELINESSSDVVNALETHIKSKILDNNLSFNELTEEWKNYIKKIFKILNFFNLDSKKRIDIIKEYKNKFALILTDEVSYNPLQYIENNIDNVNKNDIENLIDFAFVLDKLKYSNEKLKILCYSIINNPNVLYCLVSQMDTLFKELKLYGEQSHSSLREREDNYELNRLNTIAKFIAGLNNNDFDKTIFGAIYKKFLKSRIIQPNYRHLELEAKILQTFKSVVNHNDYEVFGNMLQDIVYSKQYVKNYITKTVKLTNEKYNSLKNKTIDLNKVKIQVLTPDVWEGVTSEESEYVPPLEIQAYVDALNLYFSKQFDNKKKLLWNFRMGSAILNYKINDDGDFCCLQLSTLQMFVLLLLCTPAIDNRNYLSVNDIIEKTNLPEALAEKVLNSLISSNVLVENVIIQTNNNDTNNDTTNNDTTNNDTTNNDTTNNDTTNNDTTNNDTTNNDTTEDVKIRYYTYNRNYTAYPGPEYVYKFGTIPDEKYMKFVNIVKFLN
jgi:hypothetical protein